ncbi:helix-turn-helix transcriptional regulator [Spirosoma validum]|uniref:Helix-turn-helix transcriptional regulator n=1 Tax=Spirosoma validum TaxID=2771355 RepID=A0A927B9Q7_9BACT|nr:AraC family transcriptional regulator [Spirosoma validum]MBD2757843.1 helix-turn-helix transcriptional regulator [Spirosoma validum]
MEIEFVTSPDYNFLAHFSEKYNIPITGDTLTIPASLGSGSIKKIDLAPDFKLLVHDYRLKEEFIIKRRPAQSHFDLISIICHSNDELVSLSTRERQIKLAKNTEFAIQISSTDLDSVIRFPANTHIYFTVVGITARKLKSLLNLKRPNSIIQTILDNKPGFLFYESISPAVQAILRQIRNANEDNDLGLFYYQLKVQELVYLVFKKLLQRESSRHNPISRTDMDKLLQVRTAVLADLSEPPHLQALAKLVGLSQTKMKDLFKQVFGDSIYTYYQKARMEEAAFLLRQGDYSVADVGSELGFVNLSHFSRQFEKYQGITPKKYSSGE